MSQKFLETIKAVDGEALYVEYHQERLNRALDTLERYDLRQLLQPPLQGVYRCRILYDMQHIEIEYLPYTKRPIKSLKLLYDETIVYNQKYAHREELNRLFTQKEGCDDILIVQKGFVTDTSIANIAFYDGREWCTPKKPLLQGTCRARLLKEGKLIEKDICVDAIKKFKKVALMNAMIDFDIIAEENIEELFC